MRAMKGTIITGQRHAGNGLQIILPAGTQPTTMNCPRCRGYGSPDGKRACVVCHGAGRLETRELERKVVSRCIIPTGPNRICGWPIYKGESIGVLEQHATECAAEHHDVIVAQREQQHPEIMKPWDPEFASWLKLRKDAILEGRVRV